MRVALLATVLCFVCACGGSPKDPGQAATPAASSTRGTARPDTASAPAASAPAESVHTAAAPAGADGSFYEVSLTKDGAVLATYKSGGGTARQQTGHLILELNSPDELYTVAIDVQATTPGTYPVAVEAKAGSAVVVAAGPSMMRGPMASAGELKIDQLTDTICSGTFKATQGTHYLFEGKFTKIPVSRQ